MKPLITYVAGALLALMAGVALVGCGARQEPATTPPPGHGAMTSAPAGEAPTEGIVRPDEPVFDTPLDAVNSYLAWVTFAYEMANSDVATQTFTPDEEVRVNSYVQLNKEKSQRIRQRLVKFVPGEPSEVGTTTLVPAQEQWVYRYLDLTTTRAVSPTYTASYDTTYTVVRRDSGGWIVAEVEATPLGEVK